MLERPVELPRVRGGRRLFILPLVATLHLLLALLLVAALRPARMDSQTPKITQIAVPERQSLPPPQPPPMPDLTMPKRTEMAAPEIAIAPALQPATAPMSRSAVSVPAGSGGNGSGPGAQPARATPVEASAPIVTDPNCETVDTYTARIRQAIGRFSEYPAPARDARIQGTVMARFFSDARGRIIDTALTSSIVERVYRGYEEKGRYHDLIVGFTRTDADSWTWQARVQSNMGAVTPLGAGTVRAGEDGILRAPDRADGMMGLVIPDEIPSHVARVSIRFGRVADLLMLEKSVQRTLRLAQPLPAIPACLNLKMLEAVMPFRFYLERGR